MTVQEKLGRVQLLSTQWLQVTFSEKGIKKLSKLTSDDLKLELGKIFCSFFKKIHL